MASENGWEPGDIRPDDPRLVWRTVPGTNPPVNLQLQAGQPEAVMLAVAADFNAYIEPLRNEDSAAYTDGNSVFTSNHKNATAMDLNWDPRNGTRPGHPFQTRGTFNAAQMVVIGEMEDFYEGTIFWAGRWESPVDEMHWQMGYNTYGAENFARVQDFINRKIRADGFSTFRRAGQPVPPPPPVLSRADRYALLIIAEGQRRGITPRGIQIALATGLVESNFTVYANAKVPASMDIPHDAVGSDGYSVGIFQQQVRDSGNGWWWGDAATCMDPTSSAGLFYDRLARLDYNGPNSPGSYAQAVQGSAFPGRYDERFGEAVNLYNRLVGQPPPPPIPPIQPPGDDMALVPQAQWDAFYHAYMDDLPSLSPLRRLGEGSVGPLHKFVRWMDANTHIAVMKLLAGLGHPPTLQDLQDLAAADLSRYPDRADGKAMAQAILSDVTSNPQAVVQQAAQELQIPAPVQPQVVYVDRPAPAPLPVPIAETNGSAPVKTTGQIIGQAYDALEDLRLADALPIEGRAPLAALIAVLQTKNGSQL